MQRDIDRAVESVLAIGCNGERHAPTLRNVERLRIERDVEVRRRLAYCETVRESFSLEAADVAQAHEIVAVRRRLEMQARVLSAEPRPAVVVDVVDPEHRHPVWLEPRARRMHFHLVDGLADGMIAGGRIQEREASSAIALQLDVVVGMRRHRRDLDQLIADHQVIVDGDIVPRRKADAAAAGIGIVERDLGLRETPDRRAGHDAAVRVENFDDRIERRSELLGGDVEDDLLPLASGEAVHVLVGACATLCGRRCGGARPDATVHR